MAYLVLARKYRPRQFSELVGQSHVANTFQNAFKQNKVGQSYLFTGTRGVGKTSAARILAKALRCEKPPSPGASCDTCPACVEFNQGSGTDILEIDGASNNGVDNVREIRENVKFLPSHGKVKVYIIDEVHMLTGAAFNALLKTLEEPPPHIVFILATTDVQKIPATILSRCQRFDFRRVPQPVIYEYLQQIAAKEKLQAEPAALRLVARKAEGSIRDSLSLMDQLMAISGGGQVTQAQAVEVLGVVDGAFLAKLLGEIFQNKIIEALQSLEKAFLAGVEMKQLALDLAETLRNALLVKFGSPETLVEITDDERRALTEAVAPVTPETLQAAFRLVSQALEEISRSPIPRASLEMLLVRVANLGRLSTIDEVLSRLSSGTPAIAPAPNRGPSVQPLNQMAPAPAATPMPISKDKSWDQFVAFVTNARPSLGTVLEHAVPTVPVEEWKASGFASLGFRSEQLFYLEQLKLKANHAAIEALVNQFFEAKLQLRLSEARGASPSASRAASLAENKEAAVKHSVDTVKSEFLKQDIVKSAQEIFGAKLSSFDITKK